MSYVAEKHDFGILRQDGTTKVGYMLVRGEKGAPAWAEAIDEYLAQQQTQTAGYQGLPYEKELKIIQNDWRGGFGQEYYDPSDPSTYWYTYNMDLRHKGMGVCSNIPTVAALTTALSITDSGLEIWTDANNLTNWTYVEGDALPSLDREAVTINDGTYSAAITTGAGALQWAYIYQDMANWAAAYQSCVITVRWYCKTSSANHAYIQIDDGVATTESGFHTGGGAWELLTVTRTLNAAATQCRILLRCDNVADTAYWDGPAEVPARGVVRFFKGGTFNSDEYFSSGGYLFKCADSTGTITPEGLFTDSITSLAAFTDDKLYIAQGATENYWYMTTAEAFTQSDSKAHLFCAVGTTMWKSLQPRSIYSATNPILDANWSAATTVDSSANNIVDLISFDNALYIRKDDRPFYLDSGGAVNTLTNITASIADSVTNQSVLEWQANLYFPWGDQSLLEYDSVEGTFTWRNPSEQFTRVSTHDGVVSTLGADESYLYAILNDTTQIYVIAGRLEVINNVTKWIWHSLNQFTLTGCETAKVSSVYQKRLWISSTDSSESLYYIALPDNYGYVEGHGNRNFYDDAYMETVWYHADFRADTKAFIKMTVELGHGHDAAIYFEGWYKKFGDVGYTKIGNFDGTSSVRSETIFIPNDTGGNSPTSTYMRFKFVAITDDATKTPVLLNFSVQALLFPTQRKIVTCVVRVGNNIKDFQGNELEDGLTAQKAALDELVATPTWPFTIYESLDHETATTKYMRLLPQDPFKVPIYDEKGRLVEWRYFLKMQEVALS